MSAAGNASHLKASNMKPITDTQELRSIQLGILDYVHQFCQQHGLTYFLSSGTLIGAVRHGGYIPWDDDVDNYMPRRDYDLMMEQFADTTGTYRLLSPSKEPHYYYTFAKVIDTRTRMVEDEVEGYEIGVYIDIFPVDYVTEDMAERERVFKKKKLLYKIRRCKISSFNPLYSKLAYIVYKHWPMSVKKIERTIRRLIVSDKPTGTVCNMTEAGPTIGHCFPAEDIAAQTDIVFEGKTYKTMIGYQDYLSHTYGDYMTLPPVEQRVTHHFRAWWSDPRPRLCQ